LAAADKLRRETRDTPVFVVVMSAVNPDEITREEDYAAEEKARAAQPIRAFRELAE